MRARFSLAAVLSLTVALPAFAAEAVLDWRGELLKTLLPVALGVLTILGGLALRKLSAWADAKAGESVLGKTLTALPHMAEAIWAEVLEDLKDDIERVSADGKVTPEELAELKAAAVDELKEALGKHGLGALKDTFGHALDGLLGKAVSEAAARHATGQLTPAVPQ